MTAHNGANIASRADISKNVESDSINKDEIDASVDLFHALATVLAERR